MLVLQVTCERYALHFRDTRLNVLQVACYKLKRHYVSKLHVELSSYMYMSELHCRSYMLHVCVTSYIMILQVICS